MPKNRQKAHFNARDLATAVVAFRSSPDLCRALAACADKTAPLPNTPAMLLCDLYAELLKIAATKPNWNSDHPADALDPLARMAARVNYTDIYGAGLDPDRQPPPNLIGGAE